MDPRLRDLPDAPSHRPRSYSTWRIDNGYEIVIARDEEGGSK
jgi:hypothetical protein